MTHLMKNILCSTALALADFMSMIVSIYLSFGIMSLVFTDSQYRISEHQAGGLILLHWILAAICVSWFGARLRHYFYRKTFWYELKEIFRTLLIFSIIELAVMAFSEWYISRYLWLLTWFLTLLILPIARILVKATLEHLDVWQRETWIIGDGKNAYDAYLAIKSERNLGLKVVGFVSHETQDRNVASIDNIPVITADQKWLSSINKRLQFIVAVESNEGDIRNTWLRELMIRGYRFVSVIPTLRGVPLDNTDMSFIFSHEVMIFRVQHNLAKWSSRLMKRTFDIIASIGIIILLLPLLAYISLKVKKDGGPVIYGHPRVGKNGHIFKCLKFRSMVVNSSEVLRNLLETDEQARQEWNETFKLKNDPRITSIGHFLRRTSLDELPQLFNVLKGEMSLVGPRPIIYEELSRYNEEVDYYLLSKPGMTGLWQVSGRSDVDYGTRVYLDAWYVKNWSMWNDIVILLKTVSVVLRKEGAY
ncbi:undecaprenyl-phosphate galactose phosphotransferase WbaP [Klebsiella variicola]|uniref:undecaprenyl-phosphate galactose phosphotransferase WbaP n=1 Tax=Klebsiella variicola TaxID=244366 RepID=UPI001E4C9986|nr:undecaprenyl-phosphate galactose phosphotransferase WbaP [Klebsiella variicola]MCD9671652.1 undecaprenyl-phosphate galactose phosphotransferase WbaP [Klebsiella variicola subsp. variicola]UHD28022.1 undecaprenyl-phosphate galactose phosphotransferase WbaP [Klebsiella variicola subsp. variicola]HCB1225619.1 undecaprenyl-phosphate galactose phosphotransferase WbaP [Klebsiella variicola subsp. variicola]HDZ9396191.1 undecaprenyl-phosphate galactose phosphotransferase WbaP [Klebsiella variicola 